MLGRTKGHVNRIVVIDVFSFYELPGHALNAEQNSRSAYADTRHRQAALRRVLCAVRLGC
jgi:hypothetical protein